MHIDAVVFGGGAAGLWILDELTRRGSSALLLEAGALGSGQTVASQGIIHGGLKYTLTGRLNGSARAIRDMPAVWRECLAGRRDPNLSATRVRTDSCCLWRTNTLQSRFGMWGARIGLRVRPDVLSPEQRPRALAACPGEVARLDEQVIAPQSLIQNLFDLHRRRILAVDAERGLEFDWSRGTQVSAVLVRHPVSGERLRLKPQAIVLAAGAGNLGLRRRIGLETPVMQRRPLHMVMARGDLPELNGHCVDGSRTRITVTSDVDAEGRRVWQIGGNVSEAGVSLEADELVRRARREVQTVLPGIDLAGTEWSTYRVDRAEAATRTGARPENFSILEDGNVLTVWPTKLALVPRLASSVATRVPAVAAPRVFESLSIREWPRPDVARPPWEQAAAWTRLDEPRPANLGHERVA